jgi:hypothetical protein
VVQCLTSLGEYLECLAPVLAVDGIAVVQRLLTAWRNRPCLLPDLLRLLTSLLAHRRSAFACTMPHIITCCAAAFSLSGL